MQLDIFPQLKIFKVKGVQITIDPLFPLVLLFLFWQYIIAGMFSVAVVGAICFSFLILLHESGHAIMAKICKAPVYSINLHWFGGSCQYGRVKTPKKEVMIASGGILAQLLLLCISLVAMALVTSTSPILAIVFYTFVKLNIYIILFNLIPLPAFDGGKIYAYIKGRFFK